MVVWFKTYQNNREINWKQATELDKYNKQEKDPESEFIMHDKIGKFMNLYLEDFLDAAATQTDFKEARYEPSW